MADSPGGGPESGVAPIRVLCVDDNRDIAMLLEMAINSAPGMASAGVLYRADGLLQEVEQKRPDVVLLDLSMPGEDPIAIAREMAARFPESRTIVFSAYDDQELIRQAADAGAMGYVRKGGNVPAILDAIRRVANGERLFDAG
jgi:two-component system, NarL family, response regulator NreC